MGRQLVAVDLNIQSAEAVHENIDRRRERTGVIVERSADDRKLR